MNTSFSMVPRTLIIDLSLRYGGSSSRVLSLLKNFPPELLGLAGLADSDITHQATIKGYNVEIIGNKKFDPRNAKRIEVLINSKGYQVIDTQNVQSKLWGSLAASKAGSALVSTIHSWYLSEHGNNWKGKLYHAIENNTNSNLDLYITVSPEGRENLLKTGVLEESIKLIPNAIEINPDELNGDREWLNKKFNLPDENIVFCAIGRLVWAKGYEDLIDAMDIAKKKHPNISCLIVGEGNLRSALEQKIADFGLQDHVQLIGFIPPDETLSILKSSDVFLLPSRSEGTPISLLEAATLSKPILASDVGGIPEQVIHEKEALLFPPGDVQALAEGLSRLIEETNLTNRLGRNAQKRISQKFDIENLLDMTKQAYTKALNLSKIRLDQ